MTHDNYYTNILFRLCYFGELVGMVGSMETKAPSGSTIMMAVFLDMMMRITKQTDKYTRTQKQQQQKQTRFFNHRI